MELCVRNDIKFKKTERIYLESLRSDEACDDIEVNLWPLWASILQVFKLNPIIKISSSHSFEIFR